MDEAKKKALQARVIIAAKRLVKAVEYEAALADLPAGPENVVTVTHALRLVETARNWLLWSAGAFITAEEKGEIRADDIGAGYEGLPATVKHPWTPPGVPVPIRRFR